MRTKWNKWWEHRNNNKYGLAIITGSIPELEIKEYRWQQDHSERSRKNNGKIVAKTKQYKFK